MSSKKVISISPDLLKPGSNTNKPKTRKRRERKQKPTQKEIRPNTLKKALLKKIKEHQKKANDKSVNEELVREKDSKDDKVKLMMKEKAKPKEEFSESSFNSSLNYLNELSKKHNKKKGERKSRKERRAERKLEKQQRREARKSRKHVIRQQKTPPPQALQAELPQTISTMPSHQQNTPDLKVYDVPPPAIKPNLVELNSNDLKPSGEIALKRDPNKPHNKTIKAPIQVNLEHPPELKPTHSPGVAPPYSNLKNGTKPSYKQWKRTLKNNLSSDTVDSNVDSIKIYTDAIDETKQKISPKLSDREQKLTDLKAKFQDQYNNMTDFKNEKEELLRKMKEKENRPVKRKITRTIKRTHKLGKKDGKIGVLIKNTKTRKKAYEEQKDLHKTPISEVKDYLRKHELLKVGSSAPTDVIRAMYENSVLAGDIYNKNSDVLVHNYMTSEDK